MAVIKSSGNIFRDLGFSPAEAERLKKKADEKIKAEKEAKKQK